MLELNKIYNKDCIQGLLELPDECIDLTITDPPFAVDYDKKTKTIKRKQKEIKLSYDWDLITNLKQYRAFMKSCIEQLYRVSKQNSSLYLWCADNSISFFRDYLEEIGFKYKATIVWHKTNPAPQFRKVNFLSSLEFLCYAIKGKPTFNFLHQKEMHNFIETPICMGNERVGIHESQKPIDLIKHFIKISSKENDIVLDCFAGSGSHLVASQQMNRKFLGFEINPEYCKIISDRLKQKTMTGGLLPSKKEENLINDKTHIRKRTIS